MATRTERTLAENLKIDEVFPHVPQLLRMLTAEPSRLVVRREGEGRSVLQVYLPERVGNYEAFLWVFTDLEKSYVNWSRQPDPETCRRFWNNLVKSPSNPSGSELKHGLDLERIANVALRYADSVAATATAIK